MTTTNWRTNLGGAVSVLGTALLGFSVVPQLAGTSSKFLQALTITGFILSAVGKAVTALFAADAKQLEATRQETQVQLENVKSAIRTGDTSIIARQPLVDPPK